MVDADLAGADLVAAVLVAAGFDAPEAFTGAFAGALKGAVFPAEAFPEDAFAAAGFAAGVLAGVVLADAALAAAALPDVGLAGVDLELAGFPAAGLDAAARGVVLRRTAGFVAVFAAGFFGAPSLVSSVICVTPILSDMPPSPWWEGPAHWGILHTEKRTYCARVRCGWFLQEFQVFLKAVYSRKDKRTSQDFVSKRQAFA
ncbi:hypothetical protein V1T76_05900 [Roseibium sp. FZY0029]|uniref:hypothetical protein n=1 Tax=Roseibium sp. FZY0029 TaxID=3116647 RepID=UPI002EA728E6|nr:hypothetical protein [Roseibium sp. FZY0029]